MKKMPFAGLGTVVLGLALLVLSTPGDIAAKKKKQVAKAEPTAEDFMVVDCLLPGKVRRLGRRSNFITPRRPVRTTAIDCQIRGGEYTAFDRSSYSTALKVWLDEAKAGSAEAQYYVGQIYEKGLGLDPDYATAARWYNKAADQGYSAAQISLGFLYEMGLGVEQDSTQALNWYRQASGLPEEMIVLEGTEYQDLVDLKDELSQKNEEIDKLQSRLSQIQKQLEQERQEGEDSEQLQQEVRRLSRELEAEQIVASQFQLRIADLQEGLVSSSEPAATAAATPPPTAPLPKSLKFGPFNALVIGNRDYQQLEPLDEAITDARAIARVLEDRYDFAVRQVFDATRYDILSILNELREDLTEQHNLLIYYVGHSVRDKETQRSWWQPVDAEPESRTNWISTRVMNDHLDLIPAKHILVVADAAYSGILTRSSVPRLPQGMSQEKRIDYIRQILDKRSRLVMASGQGPSAFSDAFLEVLGANSNVIEASTIYRQLVDRLAVAGDSQVPEFAPLRWARTEGGGDFFFVPRRASVPSGP